MLNNQYSILKFYNPTKTPLRFIVTHPWSRLYSLCIFKQNTFCYFQFRLFHFFLLSSIIFLSTFSVIVLFFTSSSMTSLSSTKSDQSTFICFRCDMPYNKSMRTTTESTIGDQRYDFPNPAPMMAALASAFPAYPVHLLVLHFLSRPHHRLLLYHC